MHQRHFLLFSFLVFGLFFTGYGQSPVNDHCDNPIPLCFNEWIKGSNYNATTQICEEFEMLQINLCFLHEINVVIKFEFNRFTLHVALHPV